MVNLHPPIGTMSLYTLDYHQTAPGFDPDRHWPFDGGRRICWDELRNYCHYLGDCSNVQVGCLNPLNDHHTD